MKKFLRYTAISFAVLIGLIVLAAILIPKESLKEEKVIDKQLSVKDKVKEEPKAPIPEKAPVIDTPVAYNKFEYKFPQSDYAFPVDINKISTTVVKNAYTQKEDEYSPAVNVDGYILKIRFKMTNPYDKDMMAPVPNYYYISSLNKEYFSSSTTFYKQCQCKIDNSTKITDTKGRELWKVAEGKCGGLDYCIRFKAKESKEFIVTFTDPIIKDVRKLIFHSFHYEGYDFQRNRSKDKVFVIDVDENKVVGDMQL